MTTPIIQVCGDPTVDWLNVTNEVEPGLGPYFYEPDQEPPEVTLGSQPGGAALLGQLLESLIPAGQAQVQGIRLADEFLEHPVGAAVTRSWTNWQRQGGPKMSAFRILPAQGWGRTESAEWNYAANRLTGPADLLVMDDSGLGFRNHPEGWPEALTKARRRKPEHILLKLSLYGDWRGRERARTRRGVQAGEDVCQWNPLLKQIHGRGLAARTTILTALTDLRACAVRVGVSLSWERMLEEVLAAIYGQACPFVDPATGELAFQQVIVTIGASGAVLASRDGNALVFDRAGQEGDFERAFPGSISGYNTCVMGALAAAWVAEPARMDWRKAALEGVGLARYLHYGGYSIVGQPEHPHLHLPSEALARQLAARRTPEPATPAEARVWDLGLFVDRRGVARDRNVAGSWTILKEVLLEGLSREAAGSATGRGVSGCACEIVRRGPTQALTGIPIETVGDWRSADRREIEGVHSVGNAMLEYLQLRRPETPMAVAVFGPPGSGKSFAVKEVAKGLGLPKDAQLTFNLSQFGSPEQLAAAFHQIRDLHLKGKTPVVFWDEFDGLCEGRPLGWLTHFLAPLQDGVFVDRGLSHPIGGGIYVFAGGTCRSFAAFCEGSGKQDKEAKKPDFISRLRAYIDVKGPNGDPNPVEDELYTVRRAFLLHTFLERHASQLARRGEFQLEPGVLDAFLRTTNYYHGARSLESIVRMSVLRGKRKYELSALPPEHLLAMHVDARDFLAFTRLEHCEMLRVGITGHIGLDPARMAKLEAGIEWAIQLIADAFPERLLTVFSPLAVGADRLVARALLNREGARLIGVLPLPPEDYVSDFGPSDDHREDYQGAELRQEFRHWLSERAIETIVMSPSATRNEAYQKTGYYIAGYSDVLVAVWDGREAQGRGGTAEIVAKAQELRKPIVHIWAGNYKPDPKNRTNVGEKHGTIRLMNFPGEKPGVWRRPAAG